MTLLTADDVLNKKFQATKFREGYEQDEIDEYLDELVATLRAWDDERGDRRPAAPRGADVLRRAQQEVPGHQVPRGLGAGRGR